MNVGKQLGPTFVYEVIAAGLGGLPFGWTSNGDMDGEQNLTPNQQATLAEVIAAHDPTKEPPTPTLEQKLASIGVTVDELKRALTMGG
jgi:hypothetical protein